MIVGWVNCYTLHSYLLNTVTTLSLVPVWTLPPPHTHSYYTHLAAQVERLGHCELPRLRPWGHHGHVGAQGQQLRFELARTPCLGLFLFQAGLHSGTHRLLLCLHACVPASVQFAPPAANSISSGQKWLIGGGGE